MKQGKIYNKIIMLIFLLAVLCYMGYTVFSMLREPLTTINAIEYEVGGGCHSQGYVVRDETVLTSQYAITVLGRKEGEKVGIEQTVAAGYLSADAQARQSEIEANMIQLEQLQFAYSYQFDAADTAALDSKITAELSAYAQHVARRDMTSATDMSAELKGLLLRRSTDETDLALIRAQITSRTEELNRLRSAGSADTMQIRASESGYFSGRVDGYESVLTPERLTAITAAELAAVTPGAIAEQGFGRLITDSKWYYVTTVESQYVRDVSVGDWVSVSFTHDFYNALRMKIERIGDEEDGKRIVVFTTRDYIQNVTLLRQQSADIVFNAYTGLRVPKTALRMDENNVPGVFVIESAKAKWKPVTILYDNGESYVVELNKENTDNLWPGDEIIVDAKNLYDGKVVRVS